MGFAVKKGSEKAVSRRCLERPLEEYAPLGVRPIFVFLGFLLLAFLLSLFFCSLSLSQSSSSSLSLAIRPPCFIVVALTLSTLRPMACGGDPLLAKT